MAYWFTRGFSLEELIPPDTHAIYFSTPEELADKIRYFSKNDSERQKIATLGANFYRTYFNEQTIKFVYVIVICQFGCLHPYTGSDAPPITKSFVLRKQI